MCFIWCESTLGRQLSICPHRCCSANESPQVCRTDIWTRNLPCGRQANRWATPHPIWSTSHSSELHPLELWHAPRITPHPDELATPWWATRHTLMSYAIIQWATPHPMTYDTPRWATPHPDELRHTLMSYATPWWASYTLLSYATPRWATLRISELRHTPMSYATPWWATTPMSTRTHTMIISLIIHLIGLQKYNISSFASLSYLGTRQCEALH